MITLNTIHQQTKIVVDPVEGTYQTVLTIDSSVDQSDIPGLYCCTVENVRGSSSMTVVVSGDGELIKRYMYVSCCYLHPIDKYSHPTACFAVVPIPDYILRHNCYCMTKILFYLVGDLIHIC